MTEDQTNERIQAKEEDDVEGQRLASNADRIFDRSPDDEDDVEGHKVSGFIDRVNARSPDDEDDVEGHKLVK